MKRSIFILLLITVFFTEKSFAQELGGLNYVVIDTMYEKHCTSIWFVRAEDTLVSATHSPIEITAKVKNRHKKSQYDRLQAKVLKVYPYAKAAGDVMFMYEQVCVNITDEKEQRRLLELAEAEMKRQFEADLKNLTVSEGIILIKLIDRQTGNTSFKLVQELKGKFSAFMWQSVARIFGHDLKSKYDPEGEDVWIENTCAMIENGTFQVQYRYVDPFGIKNLAEKK
jgi:hypothetical protein